LTRSSEGASGVEKSEIEFAKATDMTERVLQAGERVAELSAAISELASQNKLAAILIESTGSEVTEHITQLKDRSNDHDLAANALVTQSVSTQDQILGIAAITELNRSAATRATEQINQQFAALTRLAQTSNSVSQSSEVVCDQLNRFQTELPGVTTSDDDSSSNLDVEEWKKAA
jgi:hypothetical protein